MFNLSFQEFMGFVLGPEAQNERLGVCYPCLDVFENSNELCIEMEIPGIDPEDVNVEILSRTLRINGSKNDPLVNKSVRYKRMERSFGKFCRELDIPERFDLEQVEARFKDGVLLIKIARAENKVELIKRVDIE